MTRPIQVGDLVMVVRPTLCCGAVVGLGAVFTVKELVPGCTCFGCGAPIDELGAIGGDVGIRLSRLKRIDPLPEEETIQHKEEVGA